MLIDPEHFPDFVRSMPVYASLPAGAILSLHEPFCAYLDSFDAPMKREMVDVSPARVKERKEKMRWGHLDGYHPALVSHFKVFYKKHQNI
jgi:hypothetical protein